MSTDNAQLSIFKICSLEKTHNRQAFDCGAESLNNFLKNSARQNASRFHSRTFVAYPVEEPTKIAGYYTITLNTKRFDEAPKEYRVPTEGSVPAALLGRLAVDVNFRGRRIGETLLMNALQRCRNVANELGCVAVEVEAIDEQAAAFYKKYGFLVIDERESHRLYYAMSDIVKLFTP